MIYLIIGLLVFSGIMILLSLGVLFLVGRANYIEQYGKPLPQPEIIAYNVNRQFDETRKRNVREIEQNKQIWDTTVKK